MLCFKELLLLGFIGSNLDSELFQVLHLLLKVVDKGLPTKSVYHLARDNIDSCLNLVLQASQHSHIDSVRKTDLLPCSKIDSLLSCSQNGIGALFPFLNKRPKVLQNPCLLSLNHTSDVSGDAGKLVRNNLLSLPRFDLCILLLLNNLFELLLPVLKHPLLCKFSCLDNSSLSLVNLISSAYFFVLVFFSDLSEIWLQAIKADLANIHYLVLHIHLKLVCKTKG